jgi:hypothetical protein
MQLNELTCRRSSIACFVYFGRVGRRLARLALRNADFGRRKSSGLRVGRFSFSQPRTKRRESSVCGQIALGRPVRRRGTERTGKRSKTTNVHVVECGHNLQRTANRRHEACALRGILLAHVLLPVGLQNCVSTSCGLPCGCWELTHGMRTKEVEGKNPLLDRMTRID